MTNNLAILLGLIFTCLIGLDVVFNGGAATVFLGRKMLELMAYIAFWR